MKCLLPLPPLPSFFLLLFFSSFVRSQQPFAQGNLALLFDARSGRSSENSPQMANLSSLWCQATQNGNDRMRIKSARFVHVHPPPVQTRQARLSIDEDRAFLDFGLVSISVVGKYRCEIITERDELISGNLFIYMRPVLAVNSSMRLDSAEEQNPFAWIGPSNKVGSEENAVLECPVVGYPVPKLQWHKDGSPINSSAVVEDSDGGAKMKYMMVGTKLHIRRVCTKDEGIYKCIARNEFAPRVDYPIQDYELSLEQHLRVATSLSWLPPLLVIVVCLVLLALIIYGCSAWKKYKSKQYNVAQKEGRMGQANAENQRLPDSNEMEE